MNAAALAFAELGRILQAVRKAAKPGAKRARARITEPHELGNRRTRRRNEGRSYSLLAHREWRETIAELRRGER